MSFTRFSARILVLGVVCFLQFLLPLSAQLSLSQLFSDHAVLQQKTPIPVWGWGTPDESLEITFADQTIITKVNTSGKWQVTFEPMEAGGPHQLTVKGSEKLTVNDIYVGEVWICSGQSNMEWIVKNAQNAPQEIAAANYPMIRHLKIPHIVATSPEERILQPVEWEICSPETVEDFSAVGYFFGRELHQKLNVPIGLINTSWGGTEVEAWTSGKAIQTVAYFDDELAALDDIEADNFEEREKESIREIVGEELTIEVPMANGVPVWATANTDRKEWSVMEDLPSLWENRGLTGVDGILWFSKSIEIPETWMATDQPDTVTLSLGKIDDHDITWVNGKQVGSQANYNVYRKYRFPLDVLQADKNLIAVKITDTGGGGGFWGATEEMFLTNGIDTLSLAGAWQYKHSDISINTTLSPNNYATLLFNAMVNPLIPYAMQGVIWYQGESNASRAHQYQTLFPLMIIDWRDHWGRSNFPFLFVQLANFRAPSLTPGPSSWAELREAQSMTLKLPQTGMASAIDIGEADDIHPRDKQTVGYRLALNALKIAYDNDILAQGPTYEEKRLEGSKVILTFEHVGEGLKVKDPYGYVNGFTVAGEDKIFHWAKAEIISPNQIAVYADAVYRPVAVRYGWADNPHDLNLYNSANLPVDPFRTDSWPGITEQK